VSRARHHPRRKAFFRMAFLRRPPVMGLPNVYVAMGVFTVVAGSSAFGQVQTKEQAKCINTLNKDTSKVASKQGKENSGCLKAGTKGTATTDCLTADAKGKVAAAELKTTVDESSNDCLGTHAPNFGYGGATAGNAAAKTQEVNLFNDTYGTTDPTSVISSTDKIIGGCQKAVTKDLEKIIATMWKEYLACKKGVLASATGASDLENCVTPGGIKADAKGKISMKVGKLGHDMDRKCYGLNLATTLPGTCALGWAPCLAERANCRICLALNEIDGLNVNCDLFDDDQANGSCAAPPPACAGQLVGGFCWFHGSMGASCDSTCASLGLACDPAGTIGYAGSVGSLANCTAVMAAFGMPAAAATDCAIGFLSLPGLGCTTTPTDPFWCYNPVTTCAAADTVFNLVQRACACL
jgi:hypothetical protein